MAIRGLQDGERSARPGVHRPRLSGRPPVAAPHWIVYPVALAVGVGIGLWVDSGVVGAAASVVLAKVWLGWRPSASS
jgi:hypothetical protein